MAKRCKKVGYKYKGDVLHALKLIRGNEDKREKPQRPYHCELCNQWHLTSQPIKTQEYKLKLDWSSLWQPSIKNSL